MKYKYQVVAHDFYYPSSVLFEHLGEAEDYYNKIRSVNYEEGILVTLCEIIQHKGEEPENNEIEWYLDFNK